MSGGEDDILFCVDSRVELLQLQQYLSVCELWRGRHFVQCRLQGRASPAAAGRISSPSAPSSLKHVFHRNFGLDAWSIRFKPFGQLVCQINELRIIELTMPFFISIVKIPLMFAFIAEVLFLNID